jgi:rhamnulokinase
MLPELVVHALSGELRGERTSAGTTGMIDLATGTWAKDLIADLGFDPELFGGLQPAGAPAGTWRGIPVHLVAGHDTASAVAAIPGRPRERAAFVATGTWMLVGAERGAADVSDEARAANFSNEPGALGGVRFLKNVMGLWMLEQCRAAWGSPPIDAVIALASEAPTGGPVVDATDERFLAPADMDAEVRAAAGLGPDVGRDVVARCVLDSLATATAAAVDQLGDFLGGPVSEVAVLGGGVQNALLLRLIEEASGVPVRVGPVEATALGNALVQGIALGVWTDLEAARLSLGS